MFLSELRDDNRGVSILEMALVMPFLLMLLAGVIQFGYLFTANVVLRQAAVSAAREALLSLPPRTDAEITALAEQAIAPMLISERLREVNITRNIVVNGVGGALQLELVYDLKPFIPGLIFGSGPNGEYVLRVLYTVR